MTYKSYQEQVDYDYNQQQKIKIRAREIVNEFRVSHGMPTVEEELSRVVYNSSIPYTFQEEIHPAHCFNLYLKEIRERYA
jgi:hypothetical protein